MDIALVGTGYVADFYMQTMPNHPHLHVRGVFDRDGERLRRFAEFYRVETYPSLDALLADPAIAMVVNLTNPGSHFEVSRRALEAGKHVYSEKPLATDLDQARDLVRLAAERRRLLAGAPCSLLGEAAQTLWKALREGRVGRVHLAFAELSDALVHLERYREYISLSGTPWPYRDEFLTGCTMEHAGYYVSWLAAFFGPVRRLTATANVLMPDKTPGEDLGGRCGPDFTVGVLEFDNGAVARITNSSVSPVDRSLTLIGDRGALLVAEAWDYGATVRLHPYRRTKLARGIGRFERWCKRFSPAYLLSRPLAPVRRARFQKPSAFPMDFARGPAEIADAVRQNRPARLSAEFTLHVTEVSLALQAPAEFGVPYEVRSSFAPIEPMPWAR